MIEIQMLTDKKVLTETLSRVGIANRKKKILFPTAYLYEDKEGKTFIAHFKELFMLTRENAYSNISEDDILRLKAICFCLKNWKLIDVKNEDIEPHNIFIFILPYKEKQDWVITHKFNTKFLNNNIINKDIDQ